MWKNSSRLTWTETTGYRIWQRLNCLYFVVCCCPSRLAMFEEVIALWGQYTGPPQWFVFIVFWTSKPAVLSEHREKDYRIVEVWRDLFKSLGSALLLKSGKWELVVQVRVLVTFYCLQEWRLHTNSGRLWPMFGHPHGHIAGKCAKKQVLICITEVHTPKNVFWVSGNWTVS